jgi:hypothetical protein
LGNLVLGDRIQQLQQQIEAWEALLEKLGGIDSKGGANAEIAKYQTNL